MIPQAISYSSALIGRALPLLLAFQPAARPAGGGGGGGGGASGGGAQINPMSQIFMLVAVVGFMYFFVLRPENKRRKEQEDMNRALRKGDKVVTSGGMIGNIVTIDDREVTIEIADKVKVKFMRDSIARKYDAPAPAADAAQDASTAKK